MAAAADASADRFIARTEIGDFHVDVTKANTIKIGGDKECVTLSYNPKTRDAWLDGVYTAQGSCEVSGRPIRGEGTATLVDLGFTLLKRQFPDVNPNVFLLDLSNFTCKAADGQEYEISNLVYSLLMYGQSYYQRRFGAVPDDPGHPGLAHFLARRQNMDLPQDMNFGALNPTLRPIYAVSTSWKNFFERLQGEFGHRVCEFVAPWYADAFDIISEQQWPPEIWTIDIMSRPRIPFEVRPSEKTFGGRRRSRNRRVRSRRMRSQRRRSTK
jgi:hypothetical protein